MKETRRIELGGRVLAFAISGDGTHTAASVRGKQGGGVLRVGDREADQHDEANPHPTGRFRLRALRQLDVLARRQAARRMCNRQEMAPARSQASPPKWPGPRVGTRRRA